MPSEYDAIVVGSGHNGLISALYLSQAGWRVLVLERNTEFGGAVQSGEITEPGFIHDLWSTNQTLFVSSPVYQEFKSDLERQGLRFITSDHPYRNVFPDGSSLRIYTDFERTRGEIAQHHPEDAAGWVKLYELFQTFKSSLYPLYTTPLPSLKAARVMAQALLKAGPGKVFELVQLLLNSTRELGQNYFATRELQTLFACWGLHLDFGPDVPAGVMFPLASTFDVLDRGINITEGGAGRITQALVNLIREFGGELQSGYAVTQILTDGQRATGVQLENGQTLQARRAVIANLTPRILFDELLRDAPLPGPVRKKAQRYVYGPATMMIHLALSEPLRWAAGDEIADFAYVHVAPYIEELAQSYTDAMNGLLPASPLLIVSQTTATDPSRAPAGRAVLYVQVRPLPRQIRGDAAGELHNTDWNAVKDAYADRLLAKLEAYAPGLHSRILGRTVYSPADLAAANPNLVEGDSISGSHHLRQNFLFRPFLGASRYQVPGTQNLYMVGAATWPGAGNNGVSGYLAAQLLLKQTLASQHAARLAAFLAGTGLAAAVFSQRRGR